MLLLSQNVHCMLSLIKISDEIHALYHWGLEDIFVKTVKMAKVQCKIDVFSCNLLKNRDGAMCFG